ncbi:MAG: vWA domain-containing protein [Planctomycetota bacterium]
MRTAIPALLILCAAAFAGAGWYASANIADSKLEGVERDFRIRGADTTNPSKIAVVAPPAGYREADFENALKTLERELGGESYLLLESDGGDLQSIKSRLRLERRDADYFVGEPDVLRAIHNISVAAPVPQEYLLSGITFPERVESGRPFRIALEGVRLDSEKLTISIDGAPVRRVATNPRGGEFAIETRGGVSELLCPPISAGRHFMDISGAPGEPAIRAVIVALPPPICYITPGTGEFIKSALAAQGFVMKDLVESQVPGEASLVIVTNANFTVSTLEAAVRDGIGCIVAGREAALKIEQSKLTNPELASYFPGFARASAPDPEVPPDEPGGEPEEDTVPEPEPPGSDDTNPPEPPKPQEEPKNPAPAAADPKLVKSEAPAPVVALAIVMDRSGSMAGEKMKVAKQAALASAEILAPDDYLSIVSFSDTSRVDYKSDIVGSPDKIRSILARIPPPDGGTFFYSALVDAANQLRFVNVSIRHIILITDGATADRFTADYPGLVQNVLRPAQITLSTVFVVGGGDEDPEFLGLLAKWGGGRSYPASAGDIPALVSIEVRRVAGIPEGRTRRASPSPADLNKKTGELLKPPVKPPLERRPPKPKKEKVIKPKPPRRKAIPAAEPGNFIVNSLDFSNIAPVFDFCEYQIREGAAVVLRNAETREPLAAMRATPGGSIGILGIEDSQNGIGVYETTNVFREFIARFSAAAVRSATPASDSTLVACVDGGKLVWKNGDAPAYFNLSPDHLYTGLTRPTAGGERYNSLRSLGSKPDGGAANLILTNLRSRSGSIIKNASVGKTHEGSIDAAEPARPAAPRNFFIASLIAAMAAAFATRNQRDY